MKPPRQTPPNQGLLDFESLLPLATEWATFLAASSIREGMRRSGFMIVAEELSPDSVDKFVS
jgi:hypothetical protein